MKRKCRKGTKQGAALLLAFVLAAVSSGGATVFAEEIDADAQTVTDDLISVTSIGSDDDGEEEEELVSASGTCGDNLTWVLDGGVLTISGSGEMTDWDNPWQDFDDGDVESVWYSYKDSILSVVVEDGVTSIGNNAFVDCSLLTDISISDDVASIGEGAFYGCESLMNITIPDGVTSIGYTTFIGCISLESITLPDSVTRIGSYAFYSCESLEEVTLPDNLTSIGAFAFSGCSSLKSIVIPENVTSLGNQAFEACTSLENITIPDRVTNIEASTFQYCSSLTDIELPDSITSIGDYAFENCSSLTSIDFPDSLTSIGACAFEYCSSLTSVTFSKSIESIGNFAFYNCDNLTDVYYSGTESDWAEVDIGYYNFTDATIHFAEDDEETDDSTALDISACTVTLSKTSYTYTGKTITPEVSVYDEDGEELTEDTDYTVAYDSGRKSVGSYSVTVSGIGNYSGTAAAVFTIKAVSIKTAYVSCSLSSTSYTYSGSAKKPGVTLKVKVNGSTKTLTKGTDYTVTYSDNTKIGKATVTIEGTGNFTGKITRTFKIKPKKASLKSSTKSSAKKKLTVKWSKVSGGVKYQIAYKKKGSSSWKYKTVSSSTYSKTLTGLTSGKYYYVKVRAYKTVSGTKYYGSWSDTKKVKVK